MPWFQSVSVRVDDVQCGYDISCARCDIPAAKAVTLANGGSAGGVRSGSERDQEGNCLGVQYSSDLSESMDMGLMTRSEVQLGP